MRYRVPATFIKYFIVALLGAIFAIENLGATTQAYDYTHYFEQYEIKVVENPSINTTFPFWAKPNPAQDVTDLNYWIATLPYQQDKDADAYLVYPKVGVTTVVQRPNSKDQVLISQGQMFDHYKYLVNGALHYYGTGPTEGNGNMVIAAHSSFKKDDPGRYNTVFQTLPITREGDKIFYYEKSDNGTYTMFEYTVYASFETHGFDVSIMKNTMHDKKSLTTYGCYSIGTVENRWVNSALLTSTTKNITVSPALIASHSDNQHEHAVAGEEENRYQKIDTTLGEKTPIMDNKKNSLPTYQGLNNNNPRPQSPSHSPTEAESTDNTILAQEIIETHKPYAEQVLFLVKLKSNENKAVYHIVINYIDKRLAKKTVSNYTSKEYVLLILKQLLISEL